MLIKKFLELKKLNRLAQKLRDIRLNPYAREVRTPLYKQRVIKNKKVYNRKGFKNEFDT